MRLLTRAKKHNYLLGALLAIGAIIGLVTFSDTSQAKAVTRECSPNSVINCGTLTISELRSKYNSDFTKGTKTIYSYMGISSATVNSATVKDGFVTKTGLVTVGGKTVATGAMSTGRQNISGSTKHVVNGVTFYTRTPAVSFLQSQLDAFVFLDGNGRFIGAVVKSCGNAIKAVPVAPAPKPTPTPTPTPKPTPKPAPKPAVTITKLVDQKKDKLVQIGKPFQYQLAVKNTGDTALKNAAVTDPAPTGVTFQSTNQGKIVNNTWSFTIPSLAVGQTMNFTITAIVSTNVTGTLTNKACVDTAQIPGSPDACATATVKVVTPQTKVIEVCRLSDKQVVTITETEFNNNQSAYSIDLSDCQVVPAAAEVPAVPVTPAELPQTGASDAILPLIGTGSLVASIGYYIASRRAIGQI